MSARFYKILASVVVIHVLVLSLVWVGFSAPLPRLPATFIYQGTVGAQDAPSDDQGMWAKDRSSQQVVEQVDASDIDQWTKLRDPAKFFKP